MKQPHIYFDHSATTAVHPDVLETMLPYWTTDYGNPASMHAHGRKASFALEEARGTLADLLQAKPSEIIFTGCGSESDNMAIRGAMWAARQQGTGNHLITCCIEHKAVTETAVQLRDVAGFELTILPVDAYGRVSVEDVRAAIQPNTALISIMAANNEIGTLQPIVEIGALAHDHGILFHTDAVQAAASQQWDLSHMPIDLLSMAAHKFHGPKGVGILYARQGVDLLPSLTGGSQENGKRAGTTNVAFAVGMAKAFSIAQAELASYTTHCTTLRDHFIEGVLATIPADHICLTGHPSQRLPNHASFALRHLKGNDLLIQLDAAGISASSGSACTTGNPEPSPILRALGLDNAWTLGGLRFTFGKQNSLDDIEHGIDSLATAVRQLQQFSQLFG